jgi:DNA-binding response OmpR family regulator
MNVLIAEDDMALGHFLDQGLSLDGHDVTWVADGEAALAAVAGVQPDLLILDLTLPRMDGLEVLAVMQQRFRSTSVVVLTGRAQMEERVRCLELGADDVILKPFSFHELRARLHAVERRRTRSEAAVLRFADLEMDRAARTVTQAGREIDLTQTEFSLLESLLRRRGERVCTREELLREVWKQPTGPRQDGPSRTARDPAGTNIVEVYINYLRRKLREPSGHTGASPASVIYTVRGEGYLLRTPVAGRPTQAASIAPQDTTANV